MIVRFPLIYSATLLVAIYKSRRKDYFTWKISRTDTIFPLRQNNESRMNVSKYCGLNVQTRSIVWAIMILLKVIGNMKLIKLNMNNVNLFVLMNAYIKNAIRIYELTQTANNVSVYLYATLKISNVNIYGAKQK